MATPTSLFLAPHDPASAPARDAVVAVLDGLDILGRPLGDTVFAAGEAFSRHVVYAGCSPYLAMQPPADGSLAFCHVAVHGPFDRPRLVTGANTVKPRCPACRARFDDWRERIAEWQTATSDARCGRCGAISSPHLLDWRGHAISGRVLIELRNVFPGEATPSDLLLQRLLEATGVAWRYAWAELLAG